MASKRKTWDVGQATAAARRQAHFAAGGSVATWRGRPARFQDARKQASKQACRGQVKED